MSTQMYRRKSAQTIIGQVSDSDHLITNLPRVPKNTPAQFCHVIPYIILFLTHLTIIRWMDQMMSEKLYWPFNILLHLSRVFIANNPLTNHTLFYVLCNVLHTIELNNNVFY